MASGEEGLDLLGSEGRGLWNFFLVVVGLNQTNLTSLNQFWLITRAEVDPLHGNSLQSKYD
jgi:hypothetical protein